MHATMHMLECMHESISWPFWVRSRSFRYLRNCEFFTSKQHSCNMHACWHSLGHLVFQTKIQIIFFRSLSSFVGIYKTFCENNDPELMQITNMYVFFLYEASCERNLQILNAMLWIQALSIRGKSFQDFSG